MRLINFARIAMILLVVISNPQDLSANDKSLQVLIESLDDDRYHNRLAAKTELIRRALSGQASELTKGLLHESMEVRATVAEIVIMQRQQQLNQRISAMVDPAVNGADLSWPGWRQFSHWIGDDMVARKAFATLCIRYPVAFSSLAAIDDHRNEPADPYRLNPEDPDVWVSLLVTELANAELNNAELNNAQLNNAELKNAEPNNHRQPELAVSGVRTSRIAMALSHPSMGPDLVIVKDANESMGIALQRMVSVWLAKHESTIDQRTGLRVAVRYGCDEFASKLCRTVLDDSRASASATVTAMLALSRLSRLSHSQTDPNAIFANRIGDARTAHVWQTIASKKRTVRTQVRDVAIALMLDRQGNDPRSFGFVHLEADPLLRYRDFSLGFEDDRQRNDAHQRAREFLAAQQ